MDTFVRRLPPLPAQPDVDRTRRRRGYGPHRRPGHPAGLRRLVGELGRLPAVHRLDLQPFGREEVAQFLARPSERTPPTSTTCSAAPAATPTSCGRWPPRAPTRPRAPWPTCWPAVSTGSRTTRAPWSSAPRSSRIWCPTGCCATSPGCGTSASTRRSATRWPMACCGRTARATGSRTTSCVPRCSADLAPGERARLHGRVADALEGGAGGQVRAARGRPPRRRGPGRAAGAGLVGARGRRGDAGLGAGRGAAPLRPGAVGLAGGRRRAAEVAGSSEGQVALRAARAAGLAGEPTRAAELARRAIRLCDEDGDAPGSVQARASLVRLLIAADAAGQALGPAEEAVRLAERRTSTPSRRRWPTWSWPGPARRPSAGRGARGGDRALRAAHDGVAGLEVEALTTSALLDEIGGDLDGAAARLGDAVRVARAEGEPAAELRARYALVSLRYYNGDVAGSLPVLRAALVRVDETGLRWSDPGIELRVLQAPPCSSPATSTAAWPSPRLGTRPPDVAAARLAAVGCYAAVAARRRGRRTAASPRSEESGHAEPQVGLVAGGCEADLLIWPGRPEPRGGRRGTRPGSTSTRSPERGCMAGSGSRRSAWPPWPTSRCPVGSAATTPGSAAALARGEVFASGSSASSRGAVVGRATSVPRAGPGTPAPWPSTPGCRVSRRWRTGREALAAFGYGHVYEQARCHWRLAEALVAAGDRATRRDARAGRDRGGRADGRRPAARRRSRRR